jgi:hypothetical protein
MANSGMDFLPLKFAHAKKLHLSVSKVRWINACHCVGSSHLIDTTARAALAPAYPTTPEGMLMTRAYNVVDADGHRPNGSTCGTDPKFSDRRPRHVIDENARSASASTANCWAIRAGSAASARSDVRQARSSSTASNTPKIGTAVSIRMPASWIWRGRN